MPELRHLILNPLRSLFYCISALLLLSHCGQKGGGAVDSDPHLAEMMRIGKSMSSLGHCETALHYYERALQLSNSENRQQDAAIAKLEIGIVYFNLLKYTEAERFLRQALLYFQKNGLVDLEIRARGNLALVLGVRGDLSSSIETFQDILHIYSRRGDSLGVAKSLVNLANAYSLAGQHAQAELYFHRVAQAIDLDAHPDQQYIYRFLRGRLYYDRQEYVQAQKVLDSLVAQQDHIDYGSLMSAYEILIKIAAQAKDSDRQIALLKDKYDARERHNSLEIVWEALQKDLEVKQMKQRHDWVLQRNLFWAAIILLSMALFFVLLHRKLSLKVKSLRGRSAKLCDEVQTRNSEMRSIAVYHREMMSVLDRIMVEVKKMQQTNRGREDEFADSLRRIRQTVQLYDQTQKLGDHPESYVEANYHAFQLRLSQMYPELTNTEKHICALLLIDFSTKEISSQLNISDKSVNNARSRIRKKLDIPAETAIGDFLRDI